MMLGTFEFVQISFIIKAKSIEDVLASMLDVYVSKSTLNTNLAVIGARLSEYAEKPVSMFTSSKQKG